MKVGSLWSSMSRDRLVSKVTACRMDVRGSQRQTVYVQTRILASVYIPQLEERDRRMGLLR
jgi:hypothetical protein